jgi:uncharacterized protein (TIGR03437 family)
MRFALFFLSTLALAGQYTTYIGDAYPRTVAAIATDAAGNTYVVGNRGTPSVPTTISLLSEVIAVATAPYAPNDVFVSKIGPSGNVLFTNTFAGKGIDQGLSVAVDPTGNIYVAGTTTSIDFPISNALQSQPGQFGTGFIVKLSPDGKTILYSTYFGGIAGLTSINAMKTDSSGNLYLTGTTYATDFPHTAGMPAATVIQTGIEYTSQPTSAAFVAAIDAAGDKILFAGSVGGTQTNCAGGIHDCQGTTASTNGIAIALDASKNVYFGGNTNTTNLTSTSGSFLQQGIGAFAGKIAAGGTALAYVTYLGSASELINGPLLTPANVLSSLTVDAAGNAYLAGTTGDPKFPVTPGAYQTTFAGNPVDEFGIPANTDGFVAKLKPDGSALVWATYIGGSGNDAVNSIAVDPSGYVWAVGSTTTFSFPNALGWSNGDDFLVEFNPTGSALSYSARYPTGSISEAVALDTALLLHTAGATGILAEIAATATLPIVPPATPPIPYFGIFGIGNAAGGLLAGRISPAELISIYVPSILAGGGGVIGAARRLSTDPTSLRGVQVTIGGIPAPIVEALSSQIYAVVPMGVTAQTAATIQVSNGPAFPVWIDSSDAQFFPGVINQDGTLNSETNPAKAASVVSFYATGWQSSFAPLTDGQIATQAINACASTICSASQGTIVYAGAAPGIVAGVTQFNLQLNTGAQPVAIKNLQQVAISVGGFTQSISLWVTP